jgi:MoaA/NifB/PqqE/SkfB family radical SAM enzyme
MGTALRERNSALNREEFRRGATVLASRPQVLFVELTQNCNLSCPMCRSARGYDRALNLSRDRFDAVAAELFPATAIVDLRGWGESTVLKDFPYYLAETVRYGARPRLVTNLTAGTPQLWRSLAEHDAILAVSFDAATPETFAQLRPGSRLDRILANLRTVVDARRRHGLGPDDVYFNVVAQEPALEELPMIVDVAAEYGLTRVHVNPVTLPVSHPLHLGRHLPRVRQALDGLRRRSAATGVQVTLGAALDDTLADAAAAEKRCTHPWAYCLITYGGRVGFCDHLIGAGTERYLLGDLAEASFEQIWNGPDYQELRRQHVHWADGLDDRFEECNWCYRNRYVDFEHLTVPEYGAMIVSCGAARPAR